MDAIFIGLSLYTKDLYLMRGLNLILLQICGFYLKFTGFHEIHQISWRFHIKSGEFHAWKPLNQIIQEKTSLS